MRLATIRDHLVLYKLYLQSPQNNTIERWADLQQFQNFWRVDALDFKAMYNNSIIDELDSKAKTVNQFRPKKTMLQFLDFEPDLVRMMFQDLFDESKNVGGRMDRFIFHCDELLRGINEKKLVASKHFHEDYFVISLYLSLRYPEEYTMYKYSNFKRFMEVVESKSIPNPNELNRYFKVCKAVHLQLMKDEELKEILQTLFKDEHFQGETLLLTYDFMEFIARRG